ncbi:hypothetical protein PPSIR1_40325 [Plesiocystis pacifica SIR-1]|uniref:Uncharacterized protein n=1 Tax=Plesiocystis pacifica SIR-1 TaxID=391625 RepID=A6FYJ5_9BACT|nr:hypothetical protein [Plesiocystis pacifica]EDM81267.1 hypothetical protein PPSIR1_40325 [Plesiocystis pacifica SIR-1]
MAEDERSYADDKRLRATIVLALATVIEVGWFRLRVLPEFAVMFRELGGELPAATRLVFGGAPFFLALLLAGLAVVLGVRGAHREGGRGTIAVVIAAVTALGLGVGVITALYLPVFQLGGSITN